MAPKPLFANKASMIRSANLLWLILAAAPIVYLAIGAWIALLGGFGEDPSFVLVLFLSLALVSASIVGITVFSQTRLSFLKPGINPDLVGKTFLTIANGSILSEAHAVYGLILTLFSGSIFYAIGFSLVTWASLIWIRRRFKQNLRKLPDDQSSSKS